MQSDLGCSWVYPASRRIVIGHQISGGLGSGGSGEGSGVGVGGTGSGAGGSGPGGAGCGGVEYVMRTPYPLSAVVRPRLVR